MTISATYEYHAISNDSGQLESDDPQSKMTSLASLKFSPFLEYYYYYFLQAFFCMEQSKMVWESINNLYLSLI